MISNRFTNSNAGVICVHNSTSTPLGAGGVFLGDVRDTRSYAMVLVAVYSNVVSAIDGMVVQFSTDGTNWEHEDEFTIPANKGKTFSFQPVAQFYRIKYTNGGTPQTTFRLQTSLKRSYVKPSSHRIQDSIIDEDDAELVKAVLTGKNAQGDFVNVGCNDDGFLNSNIREYLLDIYLANFCWNLKIFGMLVGYVVYI